MGTICQCSCIKSWETSHRWWQECFDLRSTSLLVGQWYIPTVQHYCTYPLQHIELCSPLLVLVSGAHFSPKLSVLDTSSLLVEPGHSCSLGAASSFSLCFCAGALLMAAGPLQRLLPIPVLGGLLRKRFYSALCRRGSCPGLCRATERWLRHSRRPPSSCRPWWCQNANQQHKWDLTCKTALLCNGSSTYFAKKCSFPTVQSMLGMSCCTRPRLTDYIA